MILRHTFDDGIDEIHGALHRSFEDEEKDFLFARLEKFDEPVFRKVLSWYLREDHPPRNMLGYFLKRCESEQGKNAPEEDLSQCYDPKFKPIHQEVLSECHELAISLLKKDKLKSGDAYISFLFRKWSTLPERNLLKFLEGQRVWLTAKKDAGTNG